MYDVYEKNVGMIEELEKFSSKDAAPKKRSNVSLPSQHGKGKHDVSSKKLKRFLVLILFKIGV